MTTDVGEAVREYILNARPQSQSNKVFLNVKAPFSPILRTTITTNFTNYCIKACLPAAMGFHSLRRSVATNMVTSGISVITVAQALGHTSIDSTKQYISLDIQHLKECALDFNGIQVGGGVL